MTQKSEFFPLQNPNAPAKDHLSLPGIPREQRIDFSSPFQFPLLQRLRLLSVPHLATRLGPLAALLAYPVAAPAQQETVQRETQRRQALAQEAESLAAEGDAALAAGHTAEAVNRYRTALERLPEAAAALSPLRRSVVGKLADTSVTYARELAEKGELDKARLALQAVLENQVAPGYPPAKTLLGQLDDPDRFNPSQTPRHSADTKKVSDLFVIAQGMVDIADYKAAKQAYNQILAVDDTNTAARRGLEGVERQINNHLRAERDYTRAKMLNEVDKQWETTVPAGPNQPGGGNAPAGSPHLSRQKKCRTRHRRTRPQSQGRQHRLQSGEQGSVRLQTGHRGTAQCPAW